MIKILIFSKDNNPYQELLYQAAKDKVFVTYLNQITNSYFLSIVLYIPLIIYYRFNGYKIFHIHWLHNFIFPYKSIIFNNFATRIFFTVYFLIILLCVKLLNYKVIWTVHNILPHEKIFINDKLIFKILSYLSNAVIAHSNSTIEDMNKSNYNTKKVSVIPIGSYEGIYINKIKNKNIARMKLQINNKEFVFLFLGLIRDYKGVDILIQKFARITKKYGNTKLVIAGECSDDTLKKYIQEQEQRLEGRIIANLNFVEDNLVQYYMNSADMFVLPFKKVTTSSTAMLGLGFGLPIICPRIGSLKDLPNNVGYFYDAENKDGLEKMMEKSIKERTKLGEKRKAGKAYSKSLSWHEISLQLVNLYKQLI